MDFDKELSKMFPYLRNTAVAHFGDRNVADAEDVAQETLLRALKFRHLFTGDVHQLRKWMLAIMFNLRRSMGRHEKLVRRHQSDLAGLVKSDLMWSAAPENPHKSLEFVEAVRALATVPAYQRDIMVQLARGDDIGEVAKGLGVERVTVRTRAYRGREKLKALVG